jgi:hypothetical protein
LTALAGVPAARDGMPDVTSVPSVQRRMRAAAFRSPGADGRRPRRLCGTLQDARRPALRDRVEAGSAPAKRDAALAT